MMVTNWQLLGGRLCLDFVNTSGARVSRGTPRGRDYADFVLRDKLGGGYHTLLGFSEAAGSISHREALRLSRVAENDPAQAASVWTRAVEFREGLYRIFKSVVEKWAPEAGDLAILDRELGIARSRERLVYRRGEFLWAWDGSEPALDALDRMLWPVARSGAELLASGDLAMVRQCGGDECGWLFLDSSRNRGRRWCDMSECGNRAKVKRFRERARAGT
jgi:predicted RNA-binding Zn ribbon-like protein